MISTLVVLTSFDSLTYGRKMDLKQERMKCPTMKSLHDKTLAMTMERDSKCP